MFKKIFLLVFVLTFALFCFSADKIHAQELNSENAFSGIAKIKLFSKGANGYLNHVSSGSGVIVSSDGLVLTNHHVVSQESLFSSEIQKDVAYQICLTKKESQEPNCDYTASLVASDKDNDLALLRIKNIEGISDQSDFSYINVSYNKVENGKKIKVLGYPDVGGDTITATEGVITGKETKHDMDWLKTDADISFGSSGGAAIDQDGNLVGIPTQGSASTMASAGYLLEIRSVEDWIKDNKDSQVTTSELEDKVIDITKKQKEIEAKNTFSLEKPAFKITKNNDWAFNYSHGNRLTIKNTVDKNGGKISFTWNKYFYDVNNDDLMSILKNSQYQSFLMGGDHREERGCGNRREYL